MPTLNINGNIRTNTAAGWAADTTVYSAKTILVTTDVVYTGTDQRKWKLADGTQTWSNLDYMPIGYGTLAQVLSTGDTMLNTQQINSEDGFSIFKVIDGQVVMKYEDADVDNQVYVLNNQSALSFTDTATYTVGGINANLSSTEVHHTTQVSLNSPLVNLPNETASRILATDGSKNIDTLNTATYPSLTELSYVKGVTSAIQTQLGNKQPLDADLTSWAGVTRATGFDTFAATPSSSNLASLVTDETGTGALVFATSPTLVTPALGTPSSGTLTNCTGLPTSGVTGYQGYVMYLQLVQFSPTDATTYYIGSTVNTTSTVDGNVRLAIPKTGTVKRIDITFTNQGVLSTNETSTIYFRLNQTTDTTISSAVVNNAIYDLVSNSSLAISVTAGDTFEIKWVTPTWATNPTNVRCVINIYIE